MSDGSDPPARIIELATEAGCTAVALTDHDSLAGHQAARDRAEQLGIGFIPGCELSCGEEGETLHLLAYWVESGAGALDELLAEQQHARSQRNERLASQLAALGLPITYEAMVEEAGGTGVGRPHAAAVLMERGVVESVQEAFDIWLGHGKPGYVTRDALHPRKAIAAIRESGGVAVLAHPLTLSDEPAELRRYVEELAAMGLSGIEAIYGRYSVEEREELSNLASSMGLAATGGSDYHGVYKPDLSIALGIGDLHVPETVLDALQAHRP